MSAEFHYTRETLRRADSATVLIMMIENLNRRKHFATGVCIDKEQGHVLTVAHLFDDISSSFTAAVIGNQKIHFVNKVLLWGTEGYDLALLTLEDYRGGLNSVPLVEDDMTGIFTGFIESIYAYKNESHSTISYVRAKAMPIKDKDYNAMENEVYAFLLKSGIEGDPYSILQTGASGSGLFTEKGLVGIVSTAYDKIGENSIDKIGSALKSRKILELINESRHLK